MIKFTRKFNGKVYNFDAYHGTTNKRDANARANDRRRRGYLARVVNAGGGYQVFFR